MKCKHCETPVSGSMSVQYIKKDWKGSGKNAGSFEYDEEIILDAGVFCCDNCLVEYLTPDEED